MIASQTPVATLDLVPLLLRAVSNQKISMLLQLDGRVDTQILTSALRHVLQYNPVLASELVVQCGQPQWHYRPERVRQASAAVLRAAAPDDVLRKHPCSLVAGRGDTLEVIVFRGPQYDAMGITIDHTAADAAGCREVVRQLGQSYSRLQRGEEIVVGVPPPRSRSLDSIWPQLGAKRCLASLLHSANATPRWQFPTGTTGGRPEPACLLRQFNAEYRGGLKAFSVRQKATINDLLLAALFRSLLDTLPAASARRRPLQFTVDLRRYLPGWQRARIANLSGADNVWLDTAKAGRFNTLVAHTHQQMRSIKQRDPGAGSSLWLKLLFAIGFTSARKLLQKAFNASRQSGRANPLLTNFGVLDRDVLAFGTTEIRHAALTAPNLLAPGLVIGASSFRNTLTLSAGFDANIADPRLVGNVLDRMINELQAAR